MPEQMTERHFRQLCQAGFSLLPERMDTPGNRALLWAIGRQESRMIYRRQIGGPARGLWQFERAGGVKGVLTHDSSRAFAHSVCNALDVAPTATAVYPALETDDTLAFCFARLLLWTDPRPVPLPIIANAGVAWNYYLRNWRPGKPHVKTWNKFWQEGLEVIRAIE